MDELDQRHWLDNFCHEMLNEVLYKGIWQEDGLRCHDRLQSGTTRVKLVIGITLLLVVMMPLGAVLMGVLGVRVTGAQLFAGTVVSREEER